MPPKKQPNPKFRKGVRGGRVAAPKKGKKKASQKQSVIVTVNSTGSGSGGSSMGMPSQAPIFIPTNYQQPLFTPPVDPVKDSLAEKLKKSQGSQVNPIDFPDEIPVSTPARGKFGSTPAKGRFDWARDGKTERNTPAKGWGFDDVYGSNPMHQEKEDSGYHSAPDFTPQPSRPLPQPRVPGSSHENPLRMGAGAQVNLNRHPNETDADYTKRMEKNRNARERRQRDKK